MKIQWNKVTWYSKWLALALFVALPFIGFYFGVRYGETKQYMADAFVNFKNASSSVAAQSMNAYYENVAEWQTDQNHNGWSIAYPIDFGVNDDYSPAPIDDWRQGMPGGPGFKPFTLTIPKAFEPQTNFDEAVLSIGMSGKNSAVAQCLIAESTDGATATGTVTINGIIFTVFHLEDVGAGNYYETTSYRTLHAGQCYAVEYTIHSSQIMNYPASYQLRPFDKAKLQSVFDRIVGTFRFK
jgi:hypothetical protein